MPAAWPTAAASPAAMSARSGHRWRASTGSSRAWQTANGCAYGPPWTRCARCGNSAAFDLAFVDADKPDYVGYWDEAVPRIRAGGAILVDSRRLGYLRASAVRSSLRSISAAVDALNRSPIDIRTPKATLTRPASIIASTERPPRSKKSLSTPHLATPSTSANRSHKIPCRAVAGARQGMQAVGLGCRERGYVDGSCRGHRDLVDQHYGHWRPAGGKDLPGVGTQFGHVQAGAVWRHVRDEVLICEPAVMLGYGDAGKGRQGGLDFVSSCRTHQPLTVHLLVPIV